MCSKYYHNLLAHICFVGDIVNANGRWLKEAFDSLLKSKTS